VLGVRPDTLLAERATDLDTGFFVIIEAIQKSHREQSTEPQEVDMKEPRIAWGLLGRRGSSQEEV
jgi:hypothetical protein